MSKIKFLIIMSCLFFGVWGQSVSKKMITLDEKQKALDLWEDADELLQASSYSNAFKILQTFINIPQITVEEAKKAIPVEDEPLGRSLILLDNYSEESDYVSLRQRALRRMAKMPIDVLEVYQTMYDSSARPFYEKGLKGDISALETVYYSFPFSSYGDDALFLLASKEMERGNFERASYLLNRFLYLYLPENTNISYGKIIAKLAWLQRKLGMLKYKIFSNYSIPSFHQNLGEMEFQVGEDSWVEYYDEKISFQGETFTLKEFLGQLYQVSLFEESKEDWPVIMGNNAHNRVAPSLKGIGKRIWEYSGKRKRGSWESETDFEIYSFPVIWKGSVLVNLEREIVCVDLKDGKVIWKHPDPALLSNKNMDYRAGTVRDDVYYTIVSRQSFLSSDEKPISSLYALSVKNGKLLWRQSKSKNPLTNEAELRLDGVQLYGTPLVWGPYVICAGVEKGQEISSYLNWFDRETGALLFQRMVCSKLRSEREREEQTVEDSHIGGISESGGVVYFSTGVGAVGAFEARTGDALWLSRYKLGTSPKKNSHLFFTQERAKGSEIIWWYNPPIVSQGYLYVTPTDISSLLMYQKEEGQIIDIFPALKNTSFQYVSGVLRDQTLLLSGPYLFQMTNLNYFETQTIGEHPTLDSRILGPGLVTESEVFLPCGKEKNLGLSLFSFRKLDLKQGAKFVAEDPWKTQDGLDLEMSCTFTVVEVQNRKYIVCVNGNRIVAFSEKE